MKKMLKKIIRKIINRLGFDIINIKRSPNFYFYREKDIVFHEALQKVRKSIFEETPSSEYRQSYHIHQIGAWGPVPALIYIDSLKRLGTNPRSLDIGCAFGTMVAFCRLLGYAPSAIDFVLEETYLGEKTKKRYQIDFFEIQIEKDTLPFEKNSFDLITMTEVLEHLQFQPLDTLRKVHDVLKDDGLFLLTTPALGPHWENKYYNCPFEEIPIYTGQEKDSKDRHWKIYSAEELKRLLAKAGFQSFIGLYLNANTGLEGLYAVATKK